MKLTYSGKTKEFTPELEDKVSAKLAKLSKFVEQKGEREIHLIHQVERHLHKVEINMNFYDHGVVGLGEDPDLPTAVNHAIEKLEKQLIRLRTRWRDTHRGAKALQEKEELNGTFSTAEPLANGSKETNANGAPRTPKVFYVNYDEGRKPMTLEEALIEMETEQDYFVYRNADRDCLSVLVRRPDGNFDLIES